MTRLPFSSPLVTTLFAGIVVFSPTAGLFAVHDKNAGPESFDIRFKLPPPKPLTPEEELATFKIAPGYHAELVAAEPMVDSPVSLAWDEKGRMFVCEMRGYMHDVEGVGEELPIGRIVLLEDTDGDGKMDKRSVYVNGLVMPRAIMCMNGGLLIAAPPRLMFVKDTTGDGVADTVQLLDESYGIAGGQPEHMANSPTWMLDNWIYSANHPKRYRFKEGKFMEEAAGMRGQWGLAQDNFGRMFYNSNSDFLRGNLVPETLGKRNPNYPSTAGLGVQILKEQITWPSHPTPGVNRGYEPKTLSETGALTNSTATCGAVIYRGSLFPTTHRGNAFIPEPAGNLVKRVVITEKNGMLTGANAAQGAEFWTSTDERFRPVNAYNGPDGALYVVDMYRGIIQHKSFLTHYLIANIQDRKLATPFDYGRIWRVVPDKSKPVAVKLPEENDKLVAFLGHADGWSRDTTQRLLVERNDPSVKAAIVEMAQKGKSPLGRIHAFWTLEGMSALTPEVITAGLNDPDPKVRATAVRLAGRPQLAELSKLINDATTDVQVALAFQLSAYPETQDATVSLAIKAGSQPLVRDAILSGLRGRELEVLKTLLETAEKKTPPAIFEALAQAVITERQKERVKSLVALIAAQPANSPTQIALLNGTSGKGTATKNAPKPKLLYLESAPPELAKLLRDASPAAKSLVAALDARLAWPDKPGVPPPQVVTPLTEAELALAEIGKGVYNSLCAGCHQPTGTGMEGLAPALVDSEWVLGNTDVLAKIVLHGVAGPMKVGNQSWNLEMPPLGTALTDEQIAGTLTYIRRQWEHTASPVSPATVAKIRTENAGRTKSWTSVELKPPAVAAAPKTTGTAPGSATTPAAKSAAQ
jgi:mono/diheme cytochrome c family protein/glucose/arabinose dehydrogenase